MAAWDHVYARRRGTKWAIILQKEIEQKDRMLQQLKYKLEENQKTQVYWSADN